MDVRSKRLMWRCVGDADGLGHVRRGELVESALLLGVQSADDVTVLDDPFVSFPYTIDIDTPLTLFQGTFRTR